MQVAVRFAVFGATFALVHQILTRGRSPSYPHGASSSKSSSSSAESNGRCRGTDDDGFFCTYADTRVERALQQRNMQHYLDNYGVRQTIDGSGEENSRMQAVHGVMIEYLRRWILAYDRHEGLKRKCTNRHDKCIFWASIGECHKNPGYMDHECMLACQRCEKLLETPTDAGQTNTNVWDLEGGAFGRRMTSPGGGRKVFLPLPGGAENHRWGDGLVELERLPDAEDEPERIHVAGRPGHN